MTKPTIVLAIVLMSVAVQQVVAHDDGGMQKIGFKQIVDPIVTGVRIDAAHVKKWREDKRRYNQCGLCGEEQPFPEDLPILASTPEMVTVSIGTPQKSVTD